MGRADQSNHWIDQNLLNHFSGLPDLILIDNSSQICYYFAYKRTLNTFYHNIRSRKSDLIDFPFSNSEFRCSLDSTTDKIFFEVVEILCVIGIFGEEQVTNIRIAVGRTITGILSNCKITRSVSSESWTPVCIMMCCLIASICLHELFLHCHWKNKCFQAGIIPVLRVFSYVPRNGSKGSDHFARLCSQNWHIVFLSFTQLSELWNGESMLWATIEEFHIGDFFRKHLSQVDKALGINYFRV